jgi:hypothetical protein
MNKPTSAGFPSRLAVTYRAVGDLIPDPRNARTHSKRQIDQIRASIEAFGTARSTSFCRQPPIPMMRSSLPSR